ncbi:helix-turn-helix domain-containing protein [Prosthecobacter sp.]|uniref:helix-turn-helix domain-containing protein n=1 Tax=Prosthecobacter sp. TaxID=1965333 RepID=UPI002ABAAD85|nr:helix-turn-helix domain-containing protein [Prosthecobacter sp.]MDZ4401754.1 helix-turn-helix domain-containing protein [Prosthecobacter sp.]
MIFPFGQTLRARREQLGLTLRDVAHRTRIPAASLRCLETADFDGLGSPTYACSFLRTYSRWLGVDATESIEMLKHTLPVGHHGGVHGGEMPYGIWREKAPVPKPSYSASPLGAVAVLSIFMMGAYGFWMHQLGQEMAARAAPRPLPMVQAVTPPSFQGLSYRQPATSKWPQIRLSSR